MSKQTEMSSEDGTPVMRSSSAMTEPSKKYAQVQTLGQRIVNELDRESQRDTLTKWMAYRLAELMELSKASDAETAERSKGEAANLILRLWERRRKWPHGDPLQHVDAILTVLAEAEQEYPQHIEPKRGSLLGIRDQLATISKDESAFLLRAEIARYDYEFHRTYLADHGDDMEDSERKVLSWIIKTMESIQARAAAGDEECSALCGSIEERQSIVKEKLAKFASRRQAAYDAISLVDLSDPADSDVAGDDGEG